MCVIINSCAAYTAYQNKADEYRKAFRLTDKDNVQIFIVPKGKAGNRGGSFIYKPMSEKALRLQTKVRAIKSKIREAEYSDMPPREKSKQLHRLRCLMKYAEGDLAAEIEAIPRAGFIIAEAD